MAALRSASAAAAPEYSRERQAGRMVGVLAAVVGAGKQY